MVASTCFIFVMFLVILVCVMGVKGRYAEDAQPPHNLCIQHEEWRKVDLQHPIHILVMYITIAMLPAFLLCGHHSCHHQLSFLHLYMPSVTTSTRS